MHKELHTIAVPIWNQKTRCVCMEYQPILYPHEVLAYLWEIGMSIPKADLHKYWDHSRSVREGWALETAASRDHVPLALYGDSARLSTVQTQEKITGVFLSLPLFRPKTVRASRYLLWSCDTFKVYSNRTLNKVFRVICWSLNAAFLGQWPRQSVNGAILDGKRGQLCADGTKFATTELRGDWEWHKVTFRFKECSWNAKNPCYRCACVASSQTNPKLQYHVVDSTAEPSFVLDCLYRFPKQSWKAHSVGF